MPALPGQASSTRTLDRNASMRTTKTQTMTRMNLEQSAPLLQRVKTAVGWMATSTLTLSSSGISPSRSQGNLSARQEATERARSERRKRHPGASQATKTFELDGVDSTQHSECLKRCMEYPLCQKICFPAEYATRHRKKEAAKKEDDDDHGSPGGAQEGRESKSFGFQDFVSAGFTVVENSKADWVDRLVPEQLGLSYVTQSKTSVQRLCYTVEKAKLPQSTNVREMRNLVDGLKKCDHVNVLLLLDVYEDESFIYFMYEHFPCCTLLSQLASNEWTQAQIVNIARECCAVTAFASSIGQLHHLGWTLCHVLLPAQAADGGDPGLAKVFGFGLMGPVLVDTPDHLLWAPESLEKYNQQSGVLGNYIPRMEGHQRIACDSWSLGAIVYSLVSRQPPFALESDILAKRWSFTLAIDEMDPESKTLVEGLLHPICERRLRPDRALHHEWIRRRWRQSPGSDQVFLKLEEFCNAPLAKRLFARFLSAFLDAEHAPDHLAKIAKSFYCMDILGNGVLSYKEIATAARLASRPDSAAQAVFGWFARNGADHVTLMTFAESMAEEVIDGRALRHAFESLDNDGSQQISAEELFHALSVFDPALTMQDVIEHIEAAELGVGDAAGDDSTKDHQIDYGEFIRLFPVWVQRSKALQDRLKSSRTRSEELMQCFRSIQPEMEDWFRGMRDLLSTIQALGNQTIQRDEHAGEAAAELRKNFSHVDHGLRCPPGTEVAPDPRQRAARRAKSAVLAAKHDQDLWGYDTFIKDIANHDHWGTLIQTEVKMLKQVLHTNGRLTGQAEQLKAHDAAEGVRSKVNEAMAKAKIQMEEYEAFVQAFETTEQLLTPVNFSMRGMRARAGIDEEDDLTYQVGTNAGEGGSRRPMSRLFREAMSYLPFKVTNHGNADLS